MLQHHARGLGDVRAGAHADGRRAHRLAHRVRARVRLPEPAHVGAGQHANHLAGVGGHDGQAVVSFQGRAHDGVVQLQTGRQRVRGGGHDILNQAVRVNDACLVHDVLAARAGVAADAHGEVGAHVFLGAAQFLVLEREPSRRRAGGRAASAPRGARPPSQERGGEGGVGNRKGDDGHGGKPRGRGRDARGRVVAFVRRGLLDTKTVSPSERRRARKRISFPREPRKQFSAAASRARLTPRHAHGASRVRLEALGSLADAVSGRAGEARVPADSVRAPPLPVGPDLRRAGDLLEGTEPPS